MHTKFAAIIITVVIVSVGLFFLFLPGTAMPPTQEHTDNVEAPVQAP